MFTRIVLKSLWIRRERFFIAVVAIMLGAAMVTSLLTVSLDIRERMGRELRNYGANLIILPGEGDYIEKFDVNHSAIIGYVPFLNFKAEVNSRNIEFIGAELEAARKMNPWWNIEGSLPGEEEVLAGTNIAKKLSLRTGDALTIGGKSFGVSGILDTGTSYDDRIFMPMQTAERISGRSGATSIQVSVLGDIDEVINYLENMNYRVKKVRQIAESEKALLDKTQFLILLVSLFVLSAASLGLLSTMITSVLERSREIGLMKALGCGNSKLSALFLAEAGVIGIAGGISGYALGILISRFIGMEIFGMAIAVKPEVFLFTILISVLIAAVASFLPIKRALSIDPVVILRGD